MPNQNGGTNGRGGKASSPNSVTPNLWADPGMAASFLAPAMASGTTHSHLIATVDALRRLVPAAVVERAYEDARRGAAWRVQVPPLAELLAHPEGRLRPV
jgi:hypothetical protein